MSFEAIKTLPSYLGAVVRAGSWNQRKTITKWWFAPASQDSKTLDEGLNYLSTLSPPQRQPFAEQVIFPSPAYRRADRADPEIPDQILAAPIMCAQIAKLLPGPDREPFLLTHLPASRALQDSFVLRRGEEVMAKRDTDHVMRYPDPAHAMRLAFETMNPEIWPRAIQMIMQNMPLQIAWMARSFTHRAEKWMAKDDRRLDHEGYLRPYFRGATGLSHIHPEIEAINEPPKPFETQPIAKKSLVPAWVDAVEHRTFAALGPEWEGRGKGQKTAQALYHTGYDPALLSG